MVQTLAWLLCLHDLCGMTRPQPTGEFLVGPARVLLLDEISTGLDSSTTCEASLTHFYGKHQLLSLVLYVQCVCSCCFLAFLHEGHTLQCCPACDSHVRVFIGLVLQL